MRLAPRAGCQPHCVASLLVMWSGCTALKCHKTQLQNIDVFNRLHYTIYKLVYLYCERSRNEI